VLLNTARPRGRPSRARSSTRRRSPRRARARGPGSSRSATAPRPAGLVALCDGAVPATLAPPPLTGVTFVAVALAAQSLTGGATAALRVATVTYVLAMQDAGVAKATTRVSTRCAVRLRDGVARGRREVGVGRRPRVHAPPPWTLAAASGRVTYALDVLAVVALTTMTAQSDATESPAGVARYSAAHCSRPAPPRRCAWRVPRVGRRVGRPCSTLPSRRAWPSSRSPVTSAAYARAGATRRRLCCSSRAARRYRAASRTVREEETGRTAACAALPRAYPCLGTGVHVPTGSPRRVIGAHALAPMGVAGAAAARCGWTRTITKTPI